MTQIFNYCTYCGTEFDDKDREFVREWDGPPVCRPCVVSGFNKLRRPFADAMLDVQELFEEAFSGLLDGDDHE